MFLLWQQDKHFPKFWANYVGNPQRKCHLIELLIKLYSNLIQQNYKTKYQVFFLNIAIPIIFHLPPQSAAQLIQRLCYFSYRGEVFLANFTTFLNWQNLWKISFHGNGNRIPPMGATHIPKVAHEIQWTYIYFLKGSTQYKVW